MTPSAPHSKKALDRFVFFSDAVFAFALTLLAVELKLPPHPGPLTSATLLEALVASRGTAVCYVLGFVIVASLWTRHHRLFEHVEDYDSGLVTLNFILLFFITLIPFAIELVSASISSPLALAIY